MTARTGLTHDALPASASALRTAIEAWIDEACPPR